MVWLLLQAKRKRLIMENAPQVAQTICHTDWNVIIAIFGAFFAAIGLIYTFLYNFKKDIRSDIDKLEERMFYLSTGKTLSQAILDERMKEKKVE